MALLVGRGRRRIRQGRRAIRDGLRTRNQTLQPERISRPGGVTASWRSRSPDDPHDDPAHNRQSEHEREAEKGEGTLARHRRTATERFEQFGTAKPDQREHEQPTTTPAIAARAFASRSTFASPSPRRVVADGTPALTAANRRVSWHDHGEGKGQVKRVGAWLPVMNHAGLALRPLAIVLSGSSTRRYMIPGMPVRGAGVASCGWGVLTNAARCARGHAHPCPRRAKGRPLVSAGRAMSTDKAIARRPARDPTIARLVIGRGAPPHPALSSRSARSQCSVASPPPSAR